jgi:hypothetical protein
VEYVAVAPNESQAVASVPVAPSRLSIDAARAKLVELRDLRILKDVPQAVRRTCILRDEMIDALLRHRPLDRGEWMERIPFDLRVDTDGGQLTYLDEILDVVSRIALWDA